MKLILALLMASCVFGKSKSEKKHNSEFTFNFEELSENVSKLELEVNEWGAKEWDQHTHVGGNISPIRTTNKTPKMEPKSVAAAEIDMKFLTQINLIRKLKKEDKTKFESLKNDIMKLRYKIEALRKKLHEGNQVPLNHDEAELFYFQKTFISELEKEAEKVISENKIQAEDDKAKKAIKESLKADMRKKLENSILKLNECEEQIDTFNTDILKEFGVMKAKLEALKKKCVAITSV